MPNSTASAWCHVCPLSSCGGAGMRPFGSRLRQSGWPSSFAPWQLAHCCEYSAAPLATLAVSPGSARGSSPGAAASPQAASMAKAQSLRERLLNRLTDFPRRSKHDGVRVALHPRPDDHRLAGRRPELARVRLEAQVELPRLQAPTVRGVDRVGIAAIPDGEDLPLRRRGTKVRPLTAHSAHHSFGNRPQAWLRPRLFRRASSPRSNDGILRPSPPCASRYARGWAR